MKKLPMLIAGTVLLTAAVFAAGSRLAGRKVLVVYYSATGTTKGVAEKIAAYTGAALFSLEPAKPYTSADLDWTNPQSRVCREHDNPKGRRVELVSTKVPDFSSYDVVFIGAPTWWGDASWVVDEFVKNTNFAGKKVVPFSTSMSSGFGNIGKNLEKMAGTGTWLSGRRFGGSTTDAEVREWIDRLF